MQGWIANRGCVAAVVATGVMVAGLGCNEPGRTAGTGGGVTAGSAGTSTSVDEASESGEPPVSGSASGSTTTAAGESSSSGPEDARFDVAPGATTGPSPKTDEGCEKVDFLFVIDNSGSMGNEQDNLITTFPLFIDAIESELDAAQDYHIMVVDSDAWLFETCPLLCITPITALPCILGGFECGVTQPFECEDVLGAGVVHPRGLDASNQDCGFVGNGRFMTSAEPDLHAAFACAARVGTGSMVDPERPMDAMVRAVSPNSDAATCNAGFLRDDAILVVTFITDENDNAGDGSSGNPAGWKTALVTAKQGNEAAIVVLGLFGDNDQPGGVCGAFGGGDGAEPSPRLREFVESFGDHGIAGSVCAPSYEAFFRDAIAIIDTTCDEFVPPVG